MLNIAVIQPKILADQNSNFVSLKQEIEKAAHQGANLIVLPELHDTPYFCQTENQNLFSLAEDIPGPKTAQYGDIAQSNQVVLVCSFFEKRAPGLYHNTAVVFDTTGEIAGKYRKMHIPDDPGYYEKYYFTPGDLGFQPIETSLGKLGVLVCWDQWFPEAARAMALKGAEILIYPTAIGWDANEAKATQIQQHENWLTIQKAHGVANGLPVVSCNRVGFEPDHHGHGQTFWGSSFITDATGKVVAQASQSETEIITASLSKDTITSQRTAWPFLRDRRVDAYQSLLTLYDN